jgi:matrix metalloproteinase-15 (membrane-inserted)
MFPHITVLLLSSPSSPPPVGNKYWLFREANLEPGYPQELTDYGRDIPYDKIETAIWWEPSGFTYFFKGDW